MDQRLFIHPLKRVGDDLTRIYVKPIRAFNQLDVQSYYLVEGLEDLTHDLSFEQDFFRYLSTMNYGQKLSSLDRDRLAFLNDCHSELFEMFREMIFEMSYQLAIFSERYFPISHIELNGHHTLRLHTRLCVSESGHGLHSAPQLLADHCANEWHRCRFQCEDR